MSENSEMRWNVAFDEAHKPRGKITTNFKSLALHLNQTGFNSYSYAEFPIQRSNLAPYDLLVFACPDFSKVSKQEIDAIKKWVTEDGGGLLLLSHAGGDKGRRSNLTELAEQFGMIFENDQCLDKTNNLGVENLPLITEFTFPHPIIEGVHDICFRAGCTLSVGGVHTTPVISSGPNAEPFESPLLLATESGEGRVVSVGSYEMFRDKISGGFDHADHRLLISNIFSWLKTTRRERIKQTGVIPAESETASPPPIALNGAPQPPMQTRASAPVNVSNISAASASVGTIPQINYTSDVKIIAQADLIKAFENQLTMFYSFKERMLAEFAVIQENTENLMRAVLASEEDLINLKELSEKAFKFEQACDQLDTTMAYEPPATATAEEISPPPVYYGSENTPLQNFSVSVEEPIPETITSKLPEPVVPTVSPIRKPRTSAKLIKKTKEELEEELVTLHNKLNSIKNLKVFVEKKFNSGKLTQAKFEKQVKKLDADNNKTKFAIDEIEGLLAKM